MRRCPGCFESIKDDLEVCPFCEYIEGTPSTESIHMSPGTKLAGRYTIGKVLGYGGFGVTYIGWDSVLEQKVAIKEFLPNGCSTRAPGQSNIIVSEGVNKEYFSVGLERFIDEAKRLSKFHKEEGIVRVFDCIAENDTAYIIMEYLEGETLSEYLKRVKIIPEEDALRILMPVMKSLEVIHQSGIIHRDIAPDNIILTKDGKAKLIDFGAARYITADLSKSLMVIVKPGYSAEEQYRGGNDQGPHTDVYSMAATLYKMLTGETPPDVLERRESIEATNKDTLRLPGKLNDSISPVVENALLNALNIRIEDRTPNMKAFISDLQSDEPVQRINGQIKKINMYRIPKWVKIAVPVCLSVIVVLAVLIATGVISFQSMFKTDVEIPEGYTLVPSVEGMSIEDAIETLSESNLNYRTGGSVITDYVDADLIVYQDPEADKAVEINSVIEITVSRGSGEIVLPENGVSTVPAFIWMEEDEAVETFEDAGLVTIIEYVYDENVTAGQVVYASDTTGNVVYTGDELPEGSEIVLYVSASSDEVPVETVIVDSDQMSEQNDLTIVPTPYPTDRFGLVIDGNYIDLLTDMRTVYDMFDSPISMVDYREHLDSYYGTLFYPYSYEYEHFSMGLLDNLELCLIAGEIENEHVLTSDGVSMGMSISQVSSILGQPDYIQPIYSEQYNYPDYEPAIYDYYYVRGESVLRIEFCTSAYPPPAFNQEDFNVVIIQLWSKALYLSQFTNNSSG